MMLLCVAVASAAGPARAQGPEERAAIGRGVQYLRGRLVKAETGESALAALALVKAGVAANDPTLKVCLDRVLQCFSGSIFTPEGHAPVDLYEAGVMAMLLANLDPVAYRPQLDALAAFLIGRQKPNGAWDYPHRMGPQPNQGDCSITQYALLGLWEAEGAGASVPQGVWDRAAGFYQRVQDRSGGWAYHPDEGIPRPTLSMTAAGSGSLLLCLRQLSRAKPADEAPSPYLKPLTGEPARAVRMTVDPRAIRSAVQRGVGWIGGNLVLTNAPVTGPSSYYTLYGIERLGAFADRDTLGRIDWYAAGRQYILRTQRPDGSWNSGYGDVPNTAWAILFLTRSTAQSIRRHEVTRLGSGTLVAGKGLPKDLSRLTIAGGRVLVRPMNGAIDEMLAVLEDPRAEDSDSALAGLVRRYRAEGPSALRPHADRFRKLLGDPDPGIRRVAAWGLGRTGRIDVAPDLIAALEDPDEGVVGAARTSLQMLSREIDGYGPAPGATPEGRREAARRWREWYDSIRPRPDSGEPGASSVESDT